MDNDTTHWECCWDRDLTSLDDCPNLGAGDEDLLLSRQRRFLEKCCDCDKFKRDLSRFRDSGHPLAPIFSACTTITAVNEPRFRP